jgi:hypothetical protein
VAAPPHRRTVSGWHLGIGASLVLVPLVTASLAIGYGPEYPTAPVIARTARPGPAAPVKAPPDRGADTAPAVEPTATDLALADPAPPADDATAVPPSRLLEPAPRATVASGPRLPQARPRRVTATRAGAEDCAPGASEQRCVFEDVLAADVRLRRAYARADRVGVSVDTLTAINQSWRRARRGAEADPYGTIDRYQRLTDALDDERLGSDR